MIQILVKGEAEMEYRIERKPQFDVFGIEAKASIESEEGCEPAELWRKAQKNGDYEKLFEAAGKLPEYVPDNLCRVHGVENYCNLDSRYTHDEVGVSIPRVSYI